MQKVHCTDCQTGHAAGNRSVTPFRYLEYEFGAPLLMRSFLWIPATKSRLVCSGFRFYRRAPMVGRLKVSHCSESGYAYEEAGCLQSGTLKSLEGPEGSAEMGNWKSRYPSDCFWLFPTQLISCTHRFLEI